MLNKTYLFKLYSSIKRLKKCYSWHKRVKTFRRFALPMINVVRLISDRLNFGTLTSVYVLFSSLDKLRKTNGLLFVAQYLKACHIYTMKYISSKKLTVNSTTYGIHVSLTKSGIPRIFPKYFRDALRRGDARYIRIILTICNLYRVLPFRGKVKLNTITDKFNGVISNDLVEFVPMFWSLLSPKKYSFIWYPYLIYKSGSITREKGQNSTSGFLIALANLYRHPHLWESIRWFFKEAPQRRGWQARNAKAWDSIVKMAQSLANTSIESVPTGKLAFKDEPGKVRVFALVDCVTQWTLRHLHDWIFSILRDLPTDATFDQDAGVELVRSKIQALISQGKTPTVFSLDLSAATDKLPLKLQVLILDNFLQGLGSAWASLLTDRSYFIRLEDQKKYCIPFDNNYLKYGTGQPMGANSSWAMLALTHHFIVQFCHWKVYNKLIWFTGYMVLGDDIIIIDSKVAKYYLSVMKRLDVGINLAKSLISVKGYAEFAKKFITPEGRVEGLSLKEFSSLGNALSNVISLAFKLKARRSNMLRLLGFGPFAAGKSPLSFMKRSYKSTLDHLLISPLVNDSDWFDWFKFVSSDWIDHWDITLPLIKYKLWCLEFSKYQFVCKLGRTTHDKGRNANIDDRIDKLVSFWLPILNPIEDAANKSLPPPNLDWFKGMISDHIFNIFTNSGMLSEITDGGPPDLVSRCMNWELSFEEGFPLFDEITSDNLWPVLSRDPKSWINQQVVKEGYDVAESMMQVDLEDNFKPCRLKDISKALSIKDYLLSSIWRSKGIYVYSTPGYEYPYKIFNTKKIK